MNPYLNHAKHLVAVDCIIFGYDLPDKELKLLLLKRIFEPTRDKWSLAGGFVQADESLDDAACRILRKLTGLDSVYMKQSYCYGDVGRDPGDRVISVAYYALTSIRDIDSDIVMRNGVHWHSVSRLPDLIFDHNAMVKKALSDLQNDIKITPAGFELLPEKFTLVQLEELYKAIYQHDIDRRNFRKKVVALGILEKLEEKETETSKRGAYYYRYNRETIEKLKREPLYFDLEVS